MQMLWLKRLQKELLGAVFETSLFAELVKQYGTDQVFYWRTQDKKEIDFVIKRPGGPLPVEVKTHFPRSVPAVLRNFARGTSSGEEQTEESDYRMISLYGEPQEEKMIYPWDL